MLKADLAGLLADRSLTGQEWGRAYAAAADRWVRQLFEAATNGDAKGLALLAVGGYGRAELAPGSDLDLVLVHNRKAPAVAKVADAIWYPIWDSGVHLDHSVRTLKEIRAAADGDLRVAGGLIDARLVAGDADLAGDVARRIKDLWATRASRWLPEVDLAVKERHRTNGALAFLLEPDLKEARGGLRDLYALDLAAKVTPVVAGTASDPELGRAAGVLAAVRVELQRSTGKESNRLYLQDQDVVAAALGLADADELMAEVSGAARTIAWASDDGWRRVLSWLAGPRGRGGSADRPIETGLVLRDDEIALAPEADPAGDPSLALRAAAVSAEMDRPLARTTLDRLAAGFQPPAGQWPAPVLDAWLRLLGAGPGTVPAVEALDQLGIWVALFPEWARVRNRPQRNAYHRFTVDRHLIETVANASQHLRDVKRPDLLLAGALLHDIGKGVGGDHTAIGIQLVRQIGPRFGFDDADTEVIASLVRHHLLLADIATRRDLDDPATIAAVVEAVGDPVTLELLAALTEADSLATGPSAWGPWKAGLVEELVRRTQAAFAGEQPVTRPPELTATQRQIASAGRLAVVADGLHVTVAAPDHTGLLAAVTGVLSLSGLLVRSAVTVTDHSDGMAVLEFDVTPAFERLPDWAKVEADVAAALDGRLPLGERLDEREQHYARRRRATAASAPAVRVTTDNHAASAATVLEVRAPDAGPVLYRITDSVTREGLSIGWARAETLGAEVVDAFYVQTPVGGKLSPEACARLEMAVTAALTSP